MEDNLVLIHFFLESGCSQSAGEVSISWKPINFMIYSPLFVEMIYEAAESWIDETTMEPDTRYERTFKHVVERDGAGAVHTEYFELFGGNQS